MPQEDKHDPPPVPPRPDPAPRPAPQPAPHPVAHGQVDCAKLLEAVRPILASKDPFERLFAHLILKMQGCSSE